MHAVLERAHRADWLGSGKLVAWAGMVGVPAGVRLQDLTRFPGDDRDCLGLGVRLVRVTGGWSWVMR